MNKKAMCFAAATVALIVTATPAWASDSDDAIEASFKKTYVNQTYLKDDSITANSKDGVVTLTGTVSEESHKALAQNTVEGITGVVSVDNKLATKAEVAAENKDTWIGRKVKLTLLFHRHVDAGKTIVDVKDGVVTLKGEASSTAQKELTTEYASDIEGVTTVKNEMTVSATPVLAERTEGKKIDDASITAQVKTALVNHRSTSSLKTKVTTRDGKVTLTGIAKNDAEKTLVSKLVNDIQGVTTVDNQMTVNAIKTL
jgi:hyperosmotically inducible periplasmic protein